MRNRIVAFIAAALFIPQLALAWGTVGHKIVGRVAHRRLGTISPTARDRAIRLLRNDDQCAPCSTQANCNVPQVERSIAGVSALPDDFRRPEGGEITSDWHFVNINVANPTYDEARDCPSGDCVVKRIDRMMAVLKDKDKQPCEKKDALIYLIHFVGDVHQPFHTGFDFMPDGKPNRGYNGVIVKLDGQERNLHSVWDTSLIVRQNRTDTGWTNHLFNDVVPGLAPAQVNNLDPVAWTNESHTFAIQNGLAANTTLTPAYIDNAEEVIDKRLALAGLRLAAMIKEALGN